MLLSLARDMIHCAAGQHEITNATVRPALENLARRMGLKRTIRLADDILETRRSIQRNANAKLALDQLMMKMAGSMAA
jgi:hypothetical protein